VWGWIGMELILIFDKQSIKNERFARGVCVWMRVYFKIITEGRKRFYRSPALKQEIMVRMDGWMDGWIEVIYHLENIKGKTQKGHTHT
jgi:hypothetical protein